MVDVDAVVSNPPYSQHWDPSHKETDPRYSYGMAAERKSRTTPFCCMNCITSGGTELWPSFCPMGYCSAGTRPGGMDGEGRIRRNLIENNHIEAIIGMPANIFYGTGIPTIIMVLRREREDSDVLFIDASKGFAKAWKIQ